MDFKTELLARLQAGESADTLAAELTKAINEANKEHERLCQEAEAKKKALEEAERKENLRRDKIEAMETFLIACENIVAIWELGDEIVDFLEHVDAKKLVDEVDEAVDMSNKYMAAWADVAKPITNKQHPAAAKPEDSIEDFLNKYVRAK